MRCVFYCLPAFLSLVIYNQPGTPLPGHIGPYPLHENTNPKARLCQELEMHRCPCEPCYEAAEVEFAAL